MINMHMKHLKWGLHDLDIERTQATGIAGLSIVADSLAAIRDTKVKVIRNEDGLIVDFEREGDYIPYGNNEESTDELAVKVTEKFMNYLRTHETYRHQEQLSLSYYNFNVVYGKKQEILQMEEEQELHLHQEQTQ